MKRRTFLSSGGMALAGYAISGCATTGLFAQHGGRAAARARQSAPVSASFDRVIRTTVGLRPHRDSGFVLRADKLGDKTLIHNYGHAGAGMSLAWGCGVMVAEFAQETGQRRAAVIGCGSPGLTAARQLQRRGFDVTIYAATVPPDTTSNMSLAGFTPTTALVVQRAADAGVGCAVPPRRRDLVPPAAADGRPALRRLLDGQLQRHRQSGAGPGRRRGGGAATRRMTDADLLPPLLRPNRNREVLGPGEHPFPTKYAVRTPTLSIEPNIYLDGLVRDFLMFGGRIVIRKFETPRDLMSLAEPIVVNCTGLGSFTLFDDKELVPIKGQLTVLMRAARGELSRRRPRRRAASNASMNPRSDGIIVGNLQDRGNWSLEPDPDVLQRNVQAAIDFFSLMRPPSPGARLTRSQPLSTVPDINSFRDATS